MTHHRAVGSSASTVRHYTDSLLLLRRSFQDEGIDAVPDPLTGHTMNIFAGWLRDADKSVARQD